MKGYKKVPLAERVDEDGFAVSSATHITNQRLTCVAVKIEGNQVQIRDTKDATKTTLLFSDAEWDAFVSGVKAGEFDV
ncbi:MAG: DUF397 domain-containing protein [Patescibacteria group bacterium]